MWCVSKSMDSGVSEFTLRIYALYKLYELDVPWSSQLRSGGKKKQKKLFLFKEFGKSNTMLRRTINNTY